jgi:protoporphyrinogen IX oxidase
MPWMVIVHIIFILFWSAGLMGILYLLAAHTQETDPEEAEFLETLERKLFLRLTTPAAVLSVVTGLWLMIRYGFDGAWMLVKLAMVTLMVLAHVLCGTLIKNYWRGKRRHSKWFYHSLNGIQLIIITAIFFLVTGKAF